MCGIAGFTGQVRNKETIIHAMCDRIKHRGPDAEGYYIDEKITLGHRRLSIIDLKTGDQPLYNEDKSIVVIYNGEIYNYKELRAELIAKGYPFQTTSDTEVLVYGYEEYKQDLPKKLRGMFAFAIWDKNKETLFIARDHFGIKPLYYTIINGELLFASEIKAFLEYPDFKKELNTDILAPYLSFGYIPTEETFFKNVYCLKPGHSAAFHDGDFQINRYFHLTFQTEKKDLDRFVTEISDAMKDSVEKHMLSDVEVGSFLSSGIDSSYLVSLARPDKTYTISYDVAKYNEADYASDLASQLKLTNQKKIINKEEYLENIPKIMYYMDEPLSDPAAVALYFLSELASKDVKVALSGEGADEFFGGYNTYREDIDFGFYNKIPFGIRKLIAKIASLLPEHRGINFLVRRGQSLEESYIGVNTVFHEKELKKILKTPSGRKNCDITKSIFAEQKGQPNINKRQAVDISLWLVHDIFQKADKMNMANSLETRVPFADIEVFKIARTLPAEAKVTKENTKIALREAAKSAIPTEAYKKKKLGFPVPLREWMKEDDYYNKINEAFHTPIANELFQSDKLHQMLEDHKNNKADNYKKIWAIYCFIVWYQDFFVENVYY